MFSATTMPATATSLFSTYASFAATMMIVRTMANDLVPSPVRSYLQSFIHHLFTPLSNTLTVVIEDLSGMIRNQVYDSAEIYLQTRLNPNTERFKVSKTSKQKKVNISLERGEEVADTFEDINLKWRFVSIEPQGEPRIREKRYFELSFHKKHKNKVIDKYLPFVLAKAKEIKDSDRSIKLYTRDGGSFDDDDGCHRGGVWGSINLEHPANFDTLAMEPEAKKAIMDDLDRFVRRREFYKKVGRAWKRGYLLYGPPGTGKSSLIAAMANYLKFDIYDLELTSLYSNSELRRILVSTTNRSIIVIEDIDCSAEMRDREMVDEPGYSDCKLTLSGLLNFIDGLWSSCGDERIIIFTTNHRDRLDPALLRPGRMDMHIHMSYCTFNGFKLLASNYLSINDHHSLYGEIENLMKNAEVTPAAIAEELMKNEDTDAALGRVVDLLKRKKMDTTDETKDDSSGLDVQEIKRAKIKNTTARSIKRMKIENTMRRSTRNSWRRVGRGGRSNRW